jgi:dTDP-4-amino-4,6-dideoxygalactose transaminase
LSNLLAALGRGQLERLDEKLNRKREINQFYRRTLEDFPGIEFMPEASYGKSNCWLTVILITPEKFGANREVVRLALEAENIESRPILNPMHMQPVFEGCRVCGGNVSEDLFMRGLSLPSGTQMTQEDLDRVVTVIESCYRATKIRYIQPIATYTGLATALLPKPFKAMLLIGFLNVIEMLSGNAVDLTGLGNVLEILS